MFNDVLGAGQAAATWYVGTCMWAAGGARFWVIDGFGGDAILERMGAFWLSLQPGGGAGPDGDASSSRTAM